MNLPKQAPGDDALFDVSIPGIYRLVRQEWKLASAIAVLCTAGALAYALNVQRYYSATTVLMTPQQQQSAAAGALAQLGALAGVPGVGTAAKAPDELYVALLRTRRIQDALIDRLDLKRRYGTSTMTDTRKRLAAMVTIAADKKAGLITLEADDVDPTFAARLANAYGEELRNLLGSLAVTEAQQRRAFFEQQVARRQAALMKAEQEFRRSQAESGLVVSAALAESGVREGAELRARIAAREVQLAAMSRFATEQNADMQRISAELSALRARLTAIEEGSGRPAERTDQGMRAVRAFREIKVQEASLETLVKQLEIARLDESREGPSLQLVDPAVPPERPTKPKRSSIVLAGAAAGLALGLTAAILRGQRRRT